MYACCKSHNRYRQQGAERIPLECHLSYKGKKRVGCWLKYNIAAVNSTALHSPLLLPASPERENRPREFDDSQVALSFMAMTERCCVISHFLRSNCRTVEAHGGPLFGAARDATIYTVVHSEGSTLKTVIPIGHGKESSIFCRCISKKNRNVIVP